MNEITETTINDWVLVKRQPGSVIPYREHYVEVPKGEVPTFPFERSINTTVSQKNGEDYIVPESDTRDTWSVDWDKSDIHRTEVGVTIEREGRMFRLTTLLDESEFSWHPKFGLREEVRPFEEQAQPNFMTRQFLVEEPEATKAVDKLTAKLREVTIEIVNLMQ